MSVLGDLAFRFDSFINLLTGQGDKNRDKTANYCVVPDPLLQPQQLENLYASSDFAARIVNSMPDEALKEGFGLTTNAGEDKPEGVSDEAKELLAEAERFDFQAKVREASTWGRLYGLGAIVMFGDGMGMMNEPFDRENPTGTLTQLLVTDRREMVPATYYNDPLSPRYGEVETYRINPNSNIGTMAAASDLLVHESRVTRYGGVMTSRRERQRNAGCDYSVMQRILPIVAQAEQNWAAVCQLMADMSQGVFTIDGLMDMIATGNEAKLQMRMQTLDMRRSVGRSILLDAEREKFERVVTPMQGVNEVMIQTWQRVAASVPMPLVVLMGMSPAGLNATGASDIRLWYDNVGKYREHELAPRMLSDLKVMSRLLGHSNADDWRITWPSLWKMTATDQADMYFKIAQADKIYLDEKVALPSEVALTRFANGDEFNPGRIQIDVQSRDEAMKLEIEKMKNPPPPPIAALGPDGKPVKALPANAASVATQEPK